MGSLPAGNARSVARFLRVFLVVFLLVVLLGAAAATTACGGSPAVSSKTYTMQGQVLSVAPERKEVVVKHEAIAGFMEAMTMPYYVRDGALLNGLKPGDLITSTLVVENEGTAYLAAVTKVGDAPLARSNASVLPGIELLHEGDRVPNASFVDQDGKPREFAAFAGHPVVLTFIYTKCPLPTFCPLMDRNFARLQPRLASDPALRNVQLVTVSFDPTTDTPAVLKQHAASLQADPARWTFLTSQTGPTGATGDAGARLAIDQFAARFGVSVMREPNATEITHNLRTAIIDASGTLVKVYTGNEWTPEQLLADLASLATTK